MRVLGIDPGIRTTGFGIVDSNINRLSLIASGTINPKVSDNLPLRLNYLFEEVELIINKFSPDIFSIEDMFYSKNVKTAMILGQARGAMIIAAAQAKIDIFEYAPRKVKMSVCGNGGASKDQYFTINKSDDNKTGHKYRWHEDNKHFLNLSDKRFEDSPSMVSKEEFLEKYDIWSASIEAPDIQQIFDEDDVKYVKLLENKILET